MEKPLPGAGPIFVENPDGSIVQGLPPGYREPSPPTTPRTGHLVWGDTEESNLAFLSNDVVRVLARHEMLFLSLLVLQLVAECLFETLHLRYREDAVFELSLIYPSLSVRVLRSLFWASLVAESAYSSVFIAFGTAAAFRAKPHLYYRFSTIALIGTIGQLPLAYLNRFNLLTFLLRFISYAYARFQWNLLRGITLLQEGMLL